MSQNYIHKMSNNNKIDKYLEWWFVRQNGFDLNKRAAC